MDMIGLYKWRFLVYIWWYYVNRMKGDDLIEEGYDGLDMRRYVMMILQLENKDNATRFPETK